MKIKTIFRYKMRKNFKENIIFGAIFDEKYKKI